MKNAIATNPMHRSTTEMLVLQVSENNFKTTFPVNFKPEDQVKVTKPFKTKVAVLETHPGKPPEPYASLLQLLARYGFSEREISIGLAGYDGSSARSYLAEIGLAGTMPGFYNLHLGGNPAGSRLNKVFKLNLSESALLNELNMLLAAFKITRRTNETFGDYALRKQLI
jgi:hypothetical protein